MTTKSTAKTVGNGNLRPFKKGYDPRRWLGGRGKKSPEQKKGEEILLAVMWKELSREFDTRTGKPITEDEGNLTALELAVRKEIKNRFDKVADRIAGKVIDRKDITSKGDSLADIGVKLIDYRTDITPTKSGSSSDSETPSQDKNPGDGA